jgi:hypothetical protein
VYSEFYGVLARMRCANEQKRIMKKELTRGRYESGV